MPFISPTENESATATFVPETQLSDCESPVELANLEKMDFGAEGRRKRSILTKVEDEVLARSFVTISDDPIIGNDQKTDDFWGRIANYYNENRPTGTPNRIASVIRSYWQNTIPKKVYRFNAKYNSIYSAYRSGHSDEDVLWLAYEKYRNENNGVAFNLEHVWRIVKDRPMFTPQSLDHVVGTKKART
ncbi:glutathione S-transferase T3-like [Primulina eburnea]|uniref:glutathione S-transferase T3-like n=1 Tax=Primulina eburnea TaxID=1245227 RepID=UPI003C6CB2D2